MNVFFNTTRQGGTTDFDGYFRIRTTAHADSIIASFVGYRNSAKDIKAGQNQEINFILEQEVINLSELVFLSGQNPANPVLRNVVQNKPMNDKRNLAQYEYHLGHLLRPPWP